MKKLILYALPLILLASCGGSKHVTKTQIVVDSSSAQEYRSMYEVEKQAREHAEQELRELQYAGVQFDTLPCPEKPGEILAPVNTVTVAPDGGITASGRIKSASTAKTKTEKSSYDKQTTIDSLVQALQKAEKNVRVQTVVKETEIKRRCLWWLWLLIGGVLGALIRHYWKAIREKAGKLFMAAKLILFPINKR